MLEAPRRAPRFAQAHPRWRSTLALTFTGLGFSRTNSDRASVLLLVLCTCLALEAGLVRTRGASLGLGVARGLWFSSDGALTSCFQS